MEKTTHHLVETVWKCRDSPLPTKFLFGYVENNKTYLYKSNQGTIELFQSKQLEKLAQLTVIMTPKDIKTIYETLPDKQEVFVIEVREKLWHHPNRQSLISDITLLTTWHPELKKIGTMPLPLPQSGKVKFFGEGKTNSFILGYIDKNSIKPFYYNHKKQAVEYLPLSEAQSLDNLAQFIDVIDKIPNRRYFLLEVAPKHRKITTPNSKKLYPALHHYLDELKQRRQVNTIKGTSNLGDQSSTMLRYARHVVLSKQLEIVSPNNYKNIKDFKPFLTNYRGDVLAIPCSARIKNLNVRFNIFGWYIDDKGFVKLRWFPHHKDAVNKRSSTIFIDIRSKQLFFSGSILDAKTQDPVFLDSIQFLDERLKQHRQAFQNGFNHFMTYIRQMKKSGRLKSKDSFPTYPHHRSRY